MGDEWFADVTPFSATKAGSTYPTETLTITDDAPPAGCPSGMTHFWKLDDANLNALVQPPLRDLRGTFPSGIVEIANDNDFVRI